MGSLGKKILDLQEAKGQVLFAIPLILTSVSYYMIPVISVMFSGHLGDVELAGATLGNIWAVLTGFALMTGLSGALETLCGKAYGARMFGMMGIYFQASVITTTLFSVAVSLLWFFSEPVFLVFRQKPEVARAASTYVSYLIPGLFPYGFLQSILRFLQTQSVVLPLVVCSFVPVSIHVGITYLMVHCTPLGIRGAALSASISLWISFIMLALYVNYSKNFIHTWKGFSRDCFNHVIPNMKLAIPSALMVCFEYGAMDSLVILAGVMPNPENSTSVIAICITTLGVAFMITYGLSAAVSTRVSNELGAGNSDRAKHALSVTLKLALVLALILVLSIVSGHSLWVGAFTKTHVIKEKFGSMTLLVATSMVLDCSQGVLSGVVRGCGWQHGAAWVNLAAYYAVGMPISCVLAFKTHLHEKGLFIGLVCGLFCQAGALLFITLRMEWRKMELPVIPVNNNKDDMCRNLT